MCAADGWQNGFGCGVMMGFLAELVITGLIILGYRLGKVSQSPHH